MKKLIFIALFAVGGLFTSLVLTSCKSDSTSGQQDLQQIFNEFPEQAKPWTWWHWMNGNITKEGITSDLEEIKKAGLAGVHIFNVTDRIPAGPVTFLSQEWMDLTLFAIEEADRIGLQTGIHNCPGWSASGGPWIEPENAIKRLVFSEYYSEGGKKIEVDLPLPADIPPMKEFYVDIKVLAFHRLKDDGNGNASRFPAWNAKAGNQVVNITLPPIKVADEGNIIDSETVVDISNYMDASGRLSWDAPEGDWTIIRFGYTYFNTNNRAAPVEGTGLECDKLDTLAIKIHFDAYARKIIEMARPYAGKSFNVMVIDSYEPRAQTWSAAFMQEFAKRRGYDITFWLPCLTGRIVGSPELTDRFLCDYRLTLSDMYRDYYYGYMRKLLSEYGMKLFVEPFGTNNINSIDAGSQADIVAFEFWMDHNNWAGSDQVKAIASASHVYDKKIVDAESFTTKPPFVMHITPLDLKIHADWGYVQGLNRLTFHSYPHQPRPDIKPGMAMGPHGTFFSSGNTWWEPGKALFEYFSRCNAMLQHGVYVADILSYTGDIAPWTEQMAQNDYKNLNYYNGYSFDYCNTDVILNRISIKNGKITLPGGITYSLLLLPKSNSMNLNVLKKIQELVKKGMVVVGESPEISQGLNGYPECDEQVKSIASQLWGETNTSSGINSYGKGKVFWGMTVEQALQELSIVPDYVCKADTSGTNVNVIHRRSNGADIYFLANGNDKAGRVDCFFRITGKQPELWDPATGEIETLEVYSKSNDGVTIPLYFDRYASMFIVFRNSDKGFEPIKEINFCANQKFVVENTDNTINISDGWNVWFDPSMGGVGNVTFEELKSWIENDNPEIRYYSGTATYKKNFNIPETMLEGKIYLNFDRIADLAKVIVNGAECGILWTPPYRVEITKYLKAGDNTIEVGVTNTWKNRLVGDERYPDDNEFAPPVEPHLLPSLGIKKLPEWYLNGEPKPDNNRVAFVTWKHYTLDSPLYDAGIIGEVKITSFENK